ncbi:hypothetical protein GCM10007916_31990 [Psychromonas marina]|uniref:HNH nuclease domain-containing protein n=1 Tax=Psychromonas marina TaxID=88364 RepID=A0ABQ6E415_9GAMM|nr:HNH endonuclease [Psychromonas marina]GLS92129.1 hypothetical protein GCM10007916_31990 [Psychromonas marina]
MAVTKGHGNPHWTRDETILALELYLNSLDKTPSGNDSRVQDLSTLLRSFPFHDNFAKNNTFRNPDGVAFKLQNLRAVATGKGLNNTSKTDKAVWKELGHDTILVKKLATDIKNGLEIISEAPALYKSNSEHDEGSVTYRIHAKRERSVALRNKFLKKCKKNGELSCELCVTQVEYIHPDYRESTFEVHHLNPLNNTGKTKNSFKDLALLCATCHRAIHKVIRDRTEPTSLEDAKLLLGINAIQGI